MGTCSSAVHEAGVPKGRLEVPNDCTSKHRSEQRIIGRFPTSPFFLASEPPVPDPVVTDLPDSTAAYSSLGEIPGCPHPRPAGFLPPVLPLYARSSCRDR